MQIVQSSTTVSASSGLNTFGQCPSGKMAIGGGFSGIPNDGSVVVRGSYQLGAPNDVTLWQYSFRNNSSGAVTIFLYTLCATVG